MIMCNVCGKYKAVEYVNFKGTHIHNCRFCPNVQVEYSLPTDLDNLKEFLGIKNELPKLVEAMRAAGSILLTNIEMGLSYKWSVGFAHDELVSAYDNLLDTFKEKLGDVKTLSVNEMLDIGFCRWDDDSELYLIPLWVLQFVPDGTLLTSISGDTKIKGVDEIDLDVRFGCLAYGIDKSQK